MPPQHLQLPNGQCFEAPARLHRRLRRTELPDFPRDLDSLIFTHTGSGVGWTICQVLRRHLPPEKSQITGFRVSVAYSFTNDDMICTVVEWRERSGVDVLAIFDVDADDPNRYSYLMHYGMDANLTMLDQFQWCWTSILWNLSERAELQTLIQAAQHVLGILEMPRTDLEVLYAGDRKQNCSTKEYEAGEDNSNMISLRHYARLLFQHFLRIEQVERLLEPSKQILEEVTSIDRKFPRYMSDGGRVSIPWGVDRSLLWLHYSLMVDFLGLHLNYITEIFP